MSERIGAVRTYRTHTGTFIIRDVWIGRKLARCEYARCITGGIVWFSCREGSAFSEIESADA